MTLISCANNRPYLGLTRLTRLLDKCGLKYEPPSEMNIERRVDLKLEYCLASVNVCTEVCEESV